VTDLSGIVTTGSGTVTAPSGVQSKSVTFNRIKRSRSPDTPVTFGRIGRSRWAGIRKQSFIAFGQCPNVLSVLAVRRSSVRQQHGINLNISSLV